MTTYSMDELLYRAAEQLADLRERVVFVGGLAEVTERHLPGDRASQARSPMVLERLRRTTRLSA